MLIAPCKHSLILWFLHIFCCCCDFEKWMIPETGGEIIPNFYDLDLTQNNISYSSLDESVLFRGLIKNIATATSEYAYSLSKRREEYEFSIKIDRSTLVALIQLNTKFENNMVINDDDLSKIRPLHNSFKNMKYLTNKEFYFTFKDNFNFKVNIDVQLLFHIINIGLFIYFVISRQYLRLVSMLCICLVVTFYLRLHEMAKIKRYEATMKGRPSQCKAYTEISLTEKVYNALSGLFSDNSDVCKDYYVSVMSSPFLDFSIAEVVIKAFSSVFFDTFIDGAGALGTAYTRLLKSVPFLLKPFVFIVFTILLLIVIIFYFGIEVRLPFYGFKTGRKEYSKQYTKKSCDNIQMNPGIIDAQAMIPIKKRNKCKRNRLYSLP